MHVKRLGRRNLRRLDLRQAWPTACEVFRGRTRTASGERFRSPPRNERVDDVDQGADVVDGGLRQDPVTEVEDMARTAPGLRQDSPGLALDFLERSEQDDRIEIPLDGDVMTEPLPGLIELDPPIEADDRAAGVALKLQQRDVPVPKWMTGTAGSSRAKSLAMCGWTNRA